jgi:uncharacterized protein
VLPRINDLIIDSSGRRLAARRIGGGDAIASGLLFLHGLHSDQTGYRARAEAASLRLGAVCLTVDLGGHGRSDGAREDLSPRNHLDDALAAYDALLASGGVDQQRVGVCGASYGAYLTALLVQRRPVRRVLLRAPSLYPDQWLDVPLRLRQPLGSPPATSAAQRSLAAFDGDVLVLESGADEVISHATVEAYLSATRRARLEVIPEATHRLTNPAWEATFVRLLLEWFADL